MKINNISLNNTKLNFDITADEYNTIKQILNDYLHGCNVYVFGSRAKNTARINSDLDLAIESQDNKKISSIIIIDLKEAFNNSNLPYNVDIIDLNNISDTFRVLVNQEKKVFPIKSIGTKGKLPKLRFRADDGNDYPAWEEKKLSDYNNMIHGDGDWILSTDIDFCGEYGIIQLGHIGHGEYINKPLKTITANKFRELNCSKIVCSDLLINRMVDNQKINACLFEKDGLYITSVDICWIRENKDFLNKFLLYSLLTTAIQNQLMNLASGSGRIRVSKKNLFDRVWFQFPSLPEQQKIADFLTSVDDLITHTKQQLELMKQYKQGIMQQIFSQKLRFRADDGSNYPDWEEKKLGDICTFFSGGTPVSSNRDYYIGDIPFIGSGNIKDESIESFINQQALENSSAKLINKGDLLLALYGATSGQCAIAKLSGAINQAVLCIRTNQIKEWIYYWLQYNKTNIINTYLQGGQGNLSAQIIKNLSLYLAINPEQQKIADFLTVIDDNIQQQTAKLEQTESYKKALWQQMLV